MPDDAREDTKTFYKNKGQAKGKHAPAYKPSDAFFMRFCKPQQKTADHKKGGHVKHINRIEYMAGLPNVPDHNKNNQYSSRAVDIIQAILLCFIFIPLFAWIPYFSKLLFSGRILSNAATSLAESVSTGLWAEGSLMQSISWLCF